MGAPGSTPLGNAPTYREGVELEIHHSKKGAYAYSTLGAAGDFGARGHRAGGVGQRVLGIIRGLLVQGRVRHERRDRSPSWSPTHRLGLGLAPLVRRGAPTPRVPLGSQREDRRQRRRHGVRRVPRPLLDRDVRRLPTVGIPLGRRPARRGVTRIRLLGHERAVDRPHAPFAHEERRALARSRSGARVGRTPRQRRP